MKLHEQVKALQSEKAALVEGINDLRRYLNSDKFTGEDTTVQAKDVLRRIQEIINTVDDLEFQNNH